MAIELAEAYISILPSTSKLAPSIKKEMAGIERQMGRSGQRAGSTFAANFKKWGGRALKGGLLAGFAGGAIGVKTAGELEQTTLSFETMLGSARKAEKFLNDIKKTAAKTPFELTGLSQASQKMLAFGFAAEDVLPTLTTIGDAAAGLGLGQEGLDRITLALGQIKAKGKVQGGEILQLTEAGIPAMKILQNELGLTADEYEKLQSQGKIKADVAIPALIKGIREGTSGLAGDTAKFGGLMEKQSQSFFGLLSTLKDTLFIGLADAAKPIMPLLKKGLKGAIKALEPAMQRLGEIMKGVARFLKRAYRRFKELVPIVKDRLKKALDKLRPTLNKVGDFLKTLADNAKAAYEWMTKNTDKVEIFAGVFASFVAGIAAYNGYVKVARILTGLWAAATGLLNAAMSANPIGLVIAAIAILVGLFILAYKKSDTFRAIVDKAWETIKNAIKFAWERVIKPAFVAFWSFITDDLIPVVKRLWNDIVKPIFKAMGDLIKAWWENIARPILQAWWKILKNVVIPILKFLWDKVVKPIFTRIGDVIKVTWQKVIKPALGGLIDFLADKVVPAFQRAVEFIAGFWSGLRDAANKAIRFVVYTLWNDGLRKVLNWIPGVNIAPVRLPASNNVTITSPSMPSFATGGYTGRGGKYDPAGIVHRDEYVIRKESRGKIEKYTPGALDYMNKYGILPLPGYARGGRVWPTTNRNGTTYPGHDGADFGAPMGAPIWAAADGTISYVGYGRGYGLAVFQTGPFGELVYGHASKTHVQPGQFVSAGHRIADIGSTGNSTGPHLHFGFPGGTFGQALAFLQGANIVGGGSGGGGWFSSMLSTIKGVIDNIRDMGSGGWMGWMKDTAIWLGKEVRKWINDKIPGPGPLPGFGIFDSGGVLEPGHFAYNASNRPEAVFNHRQFEQFADGVAGSRPRRTEIRITNWKTGEGYMREIADEAVADERSFAATTRRMR